MQPGVALKKCDADLLNKGNQKNMILLITFAQIYTDDILFFFITRFLFKVNHITIYKHICLAIHKIYFISTLIESLRNVCTWPHKTLCWPSDGKGFLSYFLGLLSNGKL
jgi:hypothetical protein